MRLCFTSFGKKSWNVQSSSVLQILVNKKSGRWRRHHEIGDWWLKDDEETQWYIRYGRPHSVLGLWTLGNKQVPQRPSVLDARTTFLCAGCKSHVPLCWMHETTFLCGGCKKQLPLRWMQESRSSTLDARHTFLYVRCKKPSSSIGLKETPHQSAQTTGLNLGTGWTNLKTKLATEENSSVLGLLTHFLN